MKRIYFSLLFLLSATSFLLAQGEKSPFAGYQEPELGERGTTRLLYWNDQTNSAVGEIAIDYGRPVWKKGYENTALFDLGTKGKVWRMGSNYWTVLDNNMPLKIAGKEIPVGLWYLGLHRSEDGAIWSLAFIDPAKTRRKHLDAVEIAKAAVEFKAPMTTEKVTEQQDKLTIVMTFNDKTYKAATLRVSWGKLQLSAPIEVTQPS